MKLGFVGTGAIAEAIVIGLLDRGAGDISITLSPRGAATSARLAGRFPHAVTVASSNQAVVDAADVVVVAVLPQTIRDALAGLRFRPDHLVLSLVAAVASGEIAGLVAPATRIVRAIPLPAAAGKASATPIMPPDPVVRDIFARTGIAIETTDARAFDALSAASGIMAGHFAAAGSVARWLTDQGVAAGDAETYVRLMLAGLAGAARPGGSSFDELTKEHTTAGGLNEQFHSHLVDHGMVETIRSGLDALLARIRGTRS